MRRSVNNAFILTVFAFLIFSCSTETPETGTVKPASVVITPVIYPGTSTYNEAQPVSITTSTDQAAIYYTLDGTVPGENSLLYTGPIAITTTVTIKAIGIKTGLKNSAVAAETLTINETRTARPVISPAVNTDEDTTVDITCPTADALIYYTLDGTDPDNTKLLYSNPFKITGVPGTSRTVKAIAYKSPLLTSEIGTVTYTFAAIGSNHPVSGPFSPVDFNGAGGAAGDEYGWTSQNINLGSAIESGSLKFALFSKNATRVLLEIYETGTGSRASCDYWMEKTTGNIWKAVITADPGKTSYYYAFRVWGPNWIWNDSWNRGNSSAGFITDVDAGGNRFNPNKTVYDPYARELSHDKEVSGSMGSTYDIEDPVFAGHDGGMYGTGGTDTKSTHVYQGINRRNWDTGKWAPKSVLFSDSTATGTRPVFSESQSIIYESHVRGLTKDSSVTNLTTILSGFSGFTGLVNIPDAERGTYKAAGKMAPYLKGLGINVIEFLPVHETANDINKNDSSGGNFWGYMTYGFFAPDRRYAYDQSPGGPTKEFKEMVAAFHAAGIKVYLDVVYNHTGEGGNWDATNKCDEITSFRGIDNSEYYCLVAADKSAYWETTGCGNNFRADNPPVRQLILDSLTYWIDSMGVDGFRFDLAPVLGRVSDGTSWNFQSGAQTLSDIAALGNSKTPKVTMIAEAWDIGTYQVGNFPSGWGEWNGKFRDSMRKFIKSEGWGTSQIGDYLYGSQSLFNDQGGPHQSVNFIVAHDGFTLADLVSFNSKNNSQAFPWGASDGGEDNNNSWNTDISYDHNGDGSINDGDDQALRRQQLRNLFTLQMFARGIPMIVYGDELGRSQNGNNNPYNLDSIATWNNYAMAGSDTPASKVTGMFNILGTDSKTDSQNNLFNFARYVIGVRKSSESLQQSDYTTASYTFSTGDSWGYTAIIDINQNNDVTKGRYLLLINSHWTDINLNIPAPPAGKAWVRIIDTAYWAESSNNYWTTAGGWIVTGAFPYAYGTRSRSVAVFQLVNQ